MRHFNNRFKCFSLLLFILSTGLVSGQNGDYRFLTLTAGVNWVDYSESLNGRDYNFLEFTNPFMFQVEGRFSEHIAVSLLGTTNEVSVPGMPPGRSYVGLDSSVHWYLDDYLWDNNDLEWDLRGGPGWYNHDGGTLKPVVNIGTGFRYWIFDQWGVSFSGAGKFNIASDAPLEDHFQYTAGVVFGLKSKKKAQPVQEDQKSELENMAQGNTGGEDVITQVPEEQAISSSFDMSVEPMMVESVYFDRNSSYIGSSEESKLDRLAELMLDDLGRRLFINTYTDDTGQLEYNQWLAGKRLERTASYLVNKGISPNRIQGEAKGVDPASRSCTDCTEEEERVYRRAEFKLYEQQ